MEFVGRHCSEEVPYLFGEQMKRVAGPVSSLLLVAAIGLVAAGIFVFRHHEKELVQRAEAAFPGPAASGHAAALDLRLPTL